MAEYVVAQAAVLIVPTLGKGADSFQAKLEKEMLKVQRKPLEIKVKADTDEMVRDVMLAKKFVEKDPIKLKLVIDQEDRRKLTEIRHQYEDLARDVKKGLLLNLKIAGLSLLPQLASGLAAVNASIVQLSQSAILLPGILAGVASSVGALATGLGGVKGAFKELGEAQKNAAADGLKARNSALNVKNAYRDLGRTMKDAQRSLEDLNAEMRGAPLDEADAIIRVQEAYAELADASEKSGLQRQKDALAVKRAENDLVDTRLRNSRLIADVAEANAKGVAGSDAVLDASERLSKALDEVSTRADKAGAALKELSPNAQQFVESVRGMGGEWDAFKSSVQDRLFDGLGAEVVRLGQNDLPILKKGFSEIAGEINGNLKTAMSALQTDTNKGFLERIFGNTAKAQGNLDKAINPLTDSLLRLSAVGTDFLPRLSDGLADLLTRFNNFLVRAEGDGSLNRWIEGGIDALNDLGNSLINVMSIMNSLSEAFTGSGGEGMLGSLEHGTAKLAEFLRSAEGQEKLTGFFSEARQQLAQWRPLLDAMPELIANVSNAAQDWADMLLPFLRTATTALADHPGLVQAAFGAYVAWNGIKPIMMGVSSVIGIANNSIDFFKQKVDEAGNKVSGSSGFKNKLSAMGQAIVSPGGVITALTSLATYLVYNVVSAHDDAAAAARRQTTDLDNLTRSLDDVTGAATRATNSMVAKNFREGINEATGANFGDLSKAVPNMPALTEKIVAGDLQGALGLVRGADAKTIENTDAWKDNKESLEAKGITSEVLAKAVNGDPDAVAKFADWQYNEMRRKAPPGVTDKNTLQGLENSKLINNTLDLADVQNQLPSDIKTGSQVQGEIYSNTLGIKQGGDTIRQDSNNAFGRAQLKPGNPFDGLGVIQGPQLSADGAGLLTSSAPAVGSPQEEQLRNDGVTFRMDGPGRYIVSMPQEAANKYLQTYASGGLINGPGSGTSDSILARLSNGEYVVNAASTAKHLPLLEQLNGGALPAFAPGGPVVPKPPPPSPSSFLDAAKNPSLYRSIDSSGSTPGAGMRPGDVNRSEFQSAGQAQAARRGRGPGTDTPQPTGVGNAVGAVGNFFKGALGLGAPGYTETSTATLSTADSAWTELRKPTVTTPKPDVNKVVSPSSQLYGIPAGTKPSGDPFPKAGKSGTAPVAPTAKPSDIVKNAPLNGFPHAGSGQPGPGGQRSTRGFPTSYGFPSSSSAINQSTGQISAGTGAALQSLLPAVTGAMATPIPAQIVDGVTAEVNFGAQEAAKYGLSVTSGLRFTDDGYHSKGQAGDYSNQKQGGPPTPEMTAFANDVLAKYAPYIDELIYSGVGSNIYDGKIVPAIDMPGSPYTTAQAGGHGDHVHIAWKTGALEQLGLANGQLGALTGTPSNMPMAGTPTGVQLPQLSYAPGGAGIAGLAGIPGANTGLMDGLKNKFKMPTPEEYFKYVSKSWSSTIENLVKNAGQIAMQFLGSFFGLDLSGILGTTNSILGGFGMGESDSEEESNLPANASVDQIMANLDLLPPEYRAAYEQAVAQNPAQATPLLNQIMAMSGQGGGQIPIFDQTKTTREKQSRGGVNPDMFLVHTSEGLDGQPLVDFMKEKGDRSYNYVIDLDGNTVRKLVDPSEAAWSVGGMNNRSINAVIGGTSASWSREEWLSRAGNALKTLAAITVNDSKKFGIPLNILKPGMDAPGIGGHEIATALGYTDHTDPGPNFPWDVYSQYLGQVSGAAGYASGGKITGKGNGRSDSILAKVSNGEYLVKASAAQKNMGLLNAINSDALPGFADGMMWPINAPAPVTPPPITTPTPPPSPVPPAPAGPQADAAAGQPTAPAPVANNMGPGDEESNTLAEVGSALGGIGAAVGAETGAEAPAGADPMGDPRSEMGAAPQNLDHNNPAVSGSIQAAGAAISSAINTAVSAAAMGSNAMAPGSGQALGAASGMISGLVGAGAGAVSGAVNILSSLGVGTLTTNPNAGAYGTPLTPQGMGQQPYSGPSVVNNWNGGVHTSNNDEFYKVQQRRELQNASPYLPNR